MKIAKASPQDVEAAFDLMAVLDAIDRGYYPAEKGSDGEDDPTFFDEDAPRAAPWGPESPGTWVRHGSGSTAPAPPNRRKMERAGRKLLVITAGQA